MGLIGSASGEMGHVALDDGRHQVRDRHDPNAGDA